MDTPALHNEKELLLKIAEGDERAFRQLYDSFNPMVYATINRYITDDEECREQLQEVFITLWQKRHLLPGIDSLENYLFIMTRNRVLLHISQLQKQIRLMKRYRYSQSLEGKPAWSSSAELREYQLHWQAAINNLPAQQKQVYILIDQQDHTLDAAALQLGLAKETVKKHLKLARKSVRSYISGRVTGSDLPGGMLLIVTALLFS